MLTTAAEDERFADALSHARPHVIEVLRRLGALGNDLEDLTQEVLARAWRYRTSFDLARPVAPWLSAIALRVWADHLSELARKPRVVGPEDGVVSGGTEARLEAREELVRALERLSPVQRDVLLAFHRDGASVEEIARSMDMRINTVKSHLHRARRALRSGLQ